MPREMLVSVDRTARLSYHVVISSATMISSLRINAVNEIDTMFKNSFSKRTRDMIMIAAPADY